MRQLLLAMGLVGCGGEWHAQQDAATDSGQGALLTTDNGAGGALLIVEFEKGFVGQSASSVIAFVNRGSKDTGPIAFEIAGPAETDFSIDPAQSTCGPALPALGRCVIVLHFLPTAAGTRSATLTFDSSPGGSGTLPLSGFATLPAVHFVPSVLDIGAMQAGTSTMRTFELRNDGSTAVALQDPQVTGAGFSRGSTTCTTTLAAGSSCDVSVVFSPMKIGPGFGFVQATVDGAKFAAPLRFRGARELKVVKAGNGSGRVTAVAAGIDCGATCRALAISTVTLVATPDAGSTLTGWSIAACGASLNCVVPVDVFATQVTATFMRTGSTSIVLSFSGTGSGDVRIREAEGPLVANCYSTCTVPVTAGTAYQIEASTWSTFSGFGGSCIPTTVTGACALTATPGTTTVTAGFDQRSGERYSRFFPGIPVHIKLDANENLILGISAIGANQLVKLSPQGVAQWVIPFSTDALGTGPQNTVFAVGTTNGVSGLFKFDENGGLLWSVPIPPGYSGGGPGLSRFANALAVGSDGSVVSLGTGGIMRWDSSGHVMWSKSLPFSVAGGVAIAPDGTVIVGHASGDTANRTVTGDRFAADGSPLSDLGIVGREWIGDLAVDSSGQVATHGAGSGITVFQWRSHTAESTTGTSGPVLPTGTCVTGAGAAVYVNNRRSDTGWDLGRMAADGTVLEMTGGGVFTSYGFGTPWLQSVACSQSSGAFAVGGEYNGFTTLNVLTASSVGFVQLLDR